MHRALAPEYLKLAVRSVSLLVSVVLLAVCCSDARAEETQHPPLEVDVFPGALWELRAAPLANDPLQGRPGSATAFSGETIEDASIGNIGDAVAATPGANFTNLSGNGQNTNITLRGAGGQTPVTTAEHPIGLYVDDVFIASPVAFDFDLFDAKRIEVLRGPQGTRGGRNSIAGAIRIETLEPRPGLAFESGLTLGNFEFRRVRASACRCLLK